jgi:hypothetical protein
MQGTLKLQMKMALLLAILALIGYFVDTPAAFWIAMFAYIVGTLAVLVEI